MSNFFIDGNSRKRKYVYRTGEDGEEFVVETEDWIRYQQKLSLNRRLRESGLPKHVESLSFDSVIGMQEEITKLSLYVEKFPQKFRSVHLYFWSSGNGTQKSTTAGILGKSLLEQGHSVRYILMSDLSKTLSSFSLENDSENNFVEEYLNVDFLIIDDSFDSKKTTMYKSGYQIPFLDTFLRNRLEIRKKATCFTSNVSVSNIDKNTFGTSLVQLVQRSIPDPFEFSVKYSKRNDFDPTTLWS